MNANKDTKRLDWIAKRGTASLGLGTHNGEWVWELLSLSLIGRGCELREAIDHAMSLEREREVGDAR